MVQTLASVACPGDAWTQIADGATQPRVRLNLVSSYQLKIAIAASAPSVGSDAWILLGPGAERQVAFDLDGGDKLWGMGGDGKTATVRLSTVPAQSVVTPGSAVVAANFARPADTAAYAIGDLILDSTTAATANANVTPGSAGIMVLPVARAADKTGMVRRLRLKTNDAAFAGKTVRAHLFKNRPTVSNGDNGAFLTTESDYLGSSDILLDRHFTDFEKGLGAPAIGSEWTFEPGSGSVNLYAVLETRDAVTPGSAKTWSLAAEVLRD